MKYFLAISFLIAVGSCVQKIEFDSPSAQSFLVVEGLISTSEGPYTVFLSQGLDLDTEEISRIPVTEASITLFDDNSNTESFTEMLPGVYQTSGNIQGEIGRSYRIQIVTNDGKEYTSEWDEILPSGNLQGIQFEYEERTDLDELDVKVDDVFKIYVDGNVPDQANYLRWRMTGIYNVKTNPELDFFWVQGNGVNKSKFPDPPPCSGYELALGVPGAQIRQFGDCTCCECWVSQYENLPQLSDARFLDNGVFERIGIGEIPINRATFEDKYLIVVEQMSMTRTSYDFFRLLREQKESASSIFQPPFGDLGGNIVAENADSPVVGLFWATDISSKEQFILREDVPYVIPSKNVVPKDCSEYYPFSSTVPHPSW